jgi:cell division protein FtsL
MTNGKLADMNSKLADMNSKLADMNSKLADMSSRIRVWRSTQHWPNICTHAAPTASII